MCLFNQASLTITVPDKPDGVYDLDPLARSINVEASSYKVGKVKVELVLAKASPGKWTELDGTDEEANDTKPAPVQSEEPIRKTGSSVLSLPDLCVNLS